MLKDQKSGGLQVFRDGFSSQIGGMDSSRYPNLIGKDYSALGVNLTFRGGRPRTRPQFQQLAYTGTGASYVKYGYFQGGLNYYNVYGNTPASNALLVGVYSGYICVIDPNSGNVAVLNPTDRNNTVLKHYVLQAENYVIVQNGLDLPYIWDGSSSTGRRSYTGPNNPVVGGYNVNIVALGHPVDPGSGLTGTSATVTTHTAHGLSNGDYVQVDGVNNSDFVNQFYIYNVTPTTFDITIDQSTIPSWPTIFGTTRRCPEIPIGLLMAYGQGRIFLSQSDRTSFSAGDLIYGDVNGQVANILRWSEVQYLASSQTYSLPNTQGRITAMVFPSFQDTTTGQGELFVFGEYGACSFQVGLPRVAITDPITGALIEAGWQDVPFQKIVLAESGCQSQWSCQNFHNGDLHYRDLIGLRSYRNARADMDNYGQTPISGEVNRILNNDPKNLLSYTSTCHFDNRVLHTCTPQFLQRQVAIKGIVISGGIATVTTYDQSGIIVGDIATIGGTNSLNGNAWTVLTTPTPTTFTFNSAGVTDPTFSSTTANAWVSTPSTATEIYHLGVVALDFTSTTTVGGKASAAWDGVWSGIKVQQITAGFNAGKAACYTFVYGGPGDNQIWQIMDTYGDDVPLIGNTVPIEWQYESRAYDFEHPFSLKRLTRLDIWISNLIGTVNFQGYYKMDGNSCWNAWPPTFQRCSITNSTILTEDNPNVQGLPQDLPQVRTQITFPRPPANCDPISGHQTNLGYDAQVRIVGTGNVTLDKLSITADDVVEKVRATCPAGSITTTTP